MKVSFNFILIFFLVFKITNAQDIYVSDTLGSNNYDGTESAPFKTIAKGIQEVDPGETIFVMNGTYTNSNYGTADPANINTLNNPNAVTINKSGQPGNYITLTNYPGHSPKIKFDGQGGIKISGSQSFIIISGFEVEGPSSQITYAQAEADRQYKITVTNDNNPNTNYNNSYFSGKGIWGGFQAHSNIIVKNNIVHDIPGSGIRFNDSDHITIENNTVYNTTWWSSSAESAIVFAETIAVDSDNGTDIKMIMRGNKVFNNWNRILFFKTSQPENSGNNNADYGTENFTQIWDGQGLYVTRSDDNYNGVFLFENNLCVNNGKNGINFDHSLAASAIMQNNTIFFNGVHEIIQDISENDEGNTAHRGQKVGGIKSNKVKNTTVVNNIIVTRDNLFSALQLNDNTGTRIVTDNIFLNGSIPTDINNIESQNMIQINPLFVNPTTIDNDVLTMSGWANYMNQTDFSLKSDSPAINSGNPSYSPEKDILGVSRPVGSGVDIGAYEYVSVSNDNSPPTITILGDNPISVFQGSTYTDQGATATDNVDGDITANITVTSNVDTSTVGTYTVTYNVSDAAGNAATEVVRTVNVVDTELSLNNTINSTISIYPNPSKGMFTIDFSVNPEDIESVKVFSLSGAIYLEDRNVVNKEYNVDLSNQSKGIYFVSIITKDKQRIVRKLLRY